MIGKRNLMDTKRANVCDESRTTVGKVDDKNAIVMMYDVDMQGMKKINDVRLFTKNIKGA